MTALMYAALYGQTSSVSLLLPVSDVLEENDENQTANHLATENGYPQLAMLIDAYAVAQSEKKALSSLVPTELAQKRKSLRV